MLMQISWLPTSWHRLENKVSRASMVAYPDYYGGAYINDNDSLVILTVGENTDKSEFVQRCKGDGLRP